MVVRRRGTLMGLVTVTALLVSTGFLWRFATDHGLLSFLLGWALLVVGLIHLVAWRESRTPSLVADLSGLQVRVGGGWVSLPWSDVATVGVGGRGRLGDGRIVVHPREERRAIVDPGPRVRFALLLNRWWYDAALVVPYGLTTRVSVVDIPGELARLADGRADVVVIDEHAAEPQPTVEVATTAGLDEPGELDALPEFGAPRELEPAGGLAPWGERDDLSGPVFHDLREAAGSDPDGQADERPAAAEPAAPRRLAAVVSALRAQGSKRADALPGGFEPSTAGTLALAHDPVVKQSLPEEAELRRRPPEEEPGLRAGMAAARLTPLEHGDRRADVAIGDRVREARVWLGLSVDDLADRTRIRPFVIESIEVGDFSACGGDFYARGHLRMLAGTLGIEADPMLALYDQNLASAPVSPKAVFDAELARGVVRPTGTGSRWGALIGTVVVLVLVWIVAKTFFGDSDVMPPVPAQGVHRTTSSAPQHRPAITDPRIGDAVAPTGPTVHLRIAATTGSSRVVVRDGSMTIIYAGTLAPGQAAGVNGAAPLRVMATDAGVVTLSSTGHPTVTMGAPGQRAFRRIPS